ncbi:MAG: DUF2029 domain-containing protein [Prevotella sp.]|nr:DUF2029 domain-containing protein [Prevotella sp.]
MNKYLTQRNLFLFGAVIALAVSLIEISRGRAYNYEIFLRGTQELLDGINPYTLDFMTRNHYVMKPESTMTEFLYLPAFALPFSLFTLLPVWLGALLWNVFNYVSFFFILRYLPSLTDKHRKMIFLFMLPLMAQNMFSFQYNFTVANMFLFSFLLLEREKYWWAILIITFSGITKIYGFVMLPILLLYPQLWKNIGRTIACIALWILLPIIYGGPQHLVSLYTNWLDYILVHAESRIFFTIRQIIRVYTGFDMGAYENILLIAVGIIVSLAILLRYKTLRATLSSRYCVFGILISLPILWGGHTELVTFIIPMAGFLLWYFTTESTTLYDKILLWAGFIILGVVPIDILCPVSIKNILIYNYDTDTGLFLNVIVAMLMWVRMIQRQACSEFKVS